MVAVCLIGASVADRDHATDRNTGYSIIRTIAGTNVEFLYWKHGHYHVLYE